MSDDEQEDALDLATRLELETARIAWQDLQRYFAAGRVIAVDPALDLIQVAAQLVQDEKTAFQTWVDDGRVAAVGDDLAQRWFETDAVVWAVVVAPWVLVQDARK